MLTQTRSDVDLWRRGGQEGERAFDRLWRRYGRALEVTVSRGLRDVRNAKVRARLESGDVLGDTLLTVLRKIDEFEYSGPGSLLSWMESIALHRIRDWIDYWEAGKRDPAMERALKESRTNLGKTNAIPTPAIGPGTAAERIESTQMLVEAVAALPDRQRRIVLLRTCMDLGWDEVALAVGAASGEAVRKEHARILRGLSESLSGEL